MPGTATAASLDFMSELRLRRWARENYVPQVDRDASWHPVILEEMLAKEQELNRQMVEGTTSSSYVPLMPAPVAVHMIHDAHYIAPAPNLVSAPERYELFT